MKNKTKMNIGFKRVPAIDKCFAILELFVRLKKPLGVSEIAKKLNYNKSTVFNMVHTLNDLGVLEKSGENKFQFGMQIYTLGKAAGRSSELISTVHPYLEKINQETKLSAFLGIRSGMRAVIIDKADTAFDIKLYSEIGMRIPLLAGAGGRVLLAQLSEAEVDDILSKNKLEKFTPNSCVNKNKYKEMVKKARRDGIATDMEEYIEGIRGFAVPLNINRANTQAAIWAVGLKRQITDETIPRYSAYLKKIAKDIEIRFTSG
ncbi:MAG: IclR family transcriptional regulator [Desulfobacterales bacterium]|nr:MAG: IclR family transcriptional regulator [Desulfobacterales bacterium]